MAYANGKIPYSAMTALSTGGHLLAAAAAAFEVWRIQAARAGYDLRPTSSSDTFRPYDVQERIFRDRYRAGNFRGQAGFTTDVRTWNGQPWTRRAGTAAAAVPGTSNHGKALAVDIKNAGAFGGPFHAWMSRTGPALGWSNTEGRSVNEPWHWVHSGARLVDNPITGGGSVTVPNIPGAPAPITPEDFMSALSDAEQRELLDAIRQTRDYVGARGGSNTKTEDSVGYKVNDIQKALTRDLPAIKQALAGVKADSWDVRLALTSALPALINKPSGEVDVEAVAAALKDTLSENVRRDVANALLKD